MYIGYTETKVFKISIIKDEAAIPIVRLLLYKKRIIGSYLILIVVATAARLTNTVATNTPDFYNNEQMFVTPRPTSHSVKNMWIISNKTVRT